jgi:membrane protein
MIDPGGPTQPTTGTPARPGRLRTAGRATKLTWRKARHDRILGLAAEAGFWALVSLPSLLLAMFGAIGYVGGVIGHHAVTQVHDDVLRGFRDFLAPSAVNTFVAPIVNEVLTKGRADVVSTGFVIALWSGSTAMTDYLNTITIAYGMRGLRGTIRNRLIALGLYLCALVVGLVLLPALALGPDLITKIFPGSLEHEASFAVHIVYFPVVGVLAVGLLAFLYKACLPVRTPWRRSLPGAFVGMALWLLFSICLRTYLTSSFRSHSAWGSLAAPLAALLFFYFTALAVLIGAELKAALDALHPEPATADARRRAAARLATITEALQDPTTPREGPAPDALWVRKKRRSRVDAARTLAPGPRNGVAPSCDVVEAARFVVDAPTADHQGIYVGDSPVSDVRVVDSRIGDSRADDAVYGPERSHEAG